MGAWRSTPELGRGAVLDLDGGVALTSHYSMTVTLLAPPERRTGKHQHNGTPEWLEAVKKPRRLPRILMRRSLKCAWQYHAGNPTTEAS